MEALAEYGVAIFAISALVIVTLGFLKFIKNHVCHSTQAMERLTEMIGNFQGPKHNQRWVSKPQTEQYPKSHLRETK